MEDRENIIGKRCGRLVALELLKEKSSNNSFLLLCKCDCGNIYKALYCDFKNNRIKSCGCIAKERINSIKNKYTDCGDFLIGVTNSGIKFKIDKDDFNKVKRYSWYDAGDGYLRATMKNNKGLFLHNLVMSNYGKIIDHINHDKLDNRKRNLRICTVSENAMNRKLGINNTSGCKGVSWRKDRNQWRATICKDGKHYFVGHFNKLEDAIVARVKAENKLFGQFSYYNSIGVDAI